MAAALAAFGPAVAGEIPVDLELVLAVDVSQSVDAREAWLQRQGYVRALSDPRVHEAIRRGRHGRIAVQYVEWAGAGLNRTTVSWRVISSGEDAKAFAAILEYEPIPNGPGTSISSILQVAAGMFDGNGIAGERRVIDVSGDGPNNQGTNVNIARQMVVDAGITINGLPILTDGIGSNLRDLDVYYEECVIGGPGAFVIAADGFETFADAILRKIILEIADEQPAGRERFPPSRMQRAQFITPYTRIRPPQKYAPACDIGERLRRGDDIPVR